MRNESDLQILRHIVPYVRSTGYAIRKPWYIPKRKLLDYLLIYVQEGECRITTTEGGYSFKDGDFCLIHPNSLHILQGETNTITPYVHLDIFYNPNREERFPIQNGQLKISEYEHLLQPRLNDIKDIQIPLIFKPSNPLQFRDKMLRIVSLWQNRDPLHELETQCLASELILSLLQSFSRIASYKIPPSQSLNWTLSYFSFHLSEPLSIADMAQRANLSPSRFATLFRENFGLPPHQYLLRLRIQHARELLTSTRLTTREIADYCGFGDIHHFSKTFKKWTGTSPGRYRDNSPLITVMKGKGNIPDYPSRLTDD